MTVLCVLLAIAFAGLLLSRIHFHFSFNLTISRDPKFNSTRKSPTGSRGRSAGGAVTSPAVPIRPSQEELDIVSALVNLGCEKSKAPMVASAAMKQGKDFDSRVKWAVQNAA